MKKHSKKLICKNCGKEGVKNFKHIETMRSQEDKAKRNNIRIYQCSCGEQLTYLGQYEGGTEGNFVVRSDFKTLEDGFDLLSNEYVCE